MQEVKKLYELEKGDRFKWPKHDTSNGYTGVFHGCDGAYGKVRWDHWPKYDKVKPYDYLDCSVEVLKL